MGDFPMQITMSRSDLVSRSLKLAAADGYPVARNRDGYLQIDFGHKKLHEAHLQQLYPDILDPRSRVSELIDRVAPGRPCTHWPMKAIIARLRSEPASETEKARHQRPE
jgi:hypothetical protein